MSDTGFTPGPWVCGNRYSSMGVYTESGDVIANTRGSQRNFDRETQLAEQDANAHLIAAAPELYAAAELALIVAESWIHDQLDGTNSLGEALVELNPVRAALAKARGES